MASGVKVSEEVKIKYDDIKKKKSYRYLVFYIKAFDLHFLLLFGSYKNEKKYAPSDHEF